MSKTKKPRQLATGRALKIAAVAARDLENSTENLLSKQAAWLSRRLGSAPDRARLVAELAFREVRL